jgi:hypothetical protein
VKKKLSEKKREGWLFDGRLGGIEKRPEANSSGLKAYVPGSSIQQRPSL